MKEEEEESSSQRWNQYYDSTPSRTCGHDSQTPSEPCVALPMQISADWVAARILSLVFCSLLRRVAVSCGLFSVVSRSLL